MPAGRMLNKKKTVLLLTCLLLALLFMLRDRLTVFCHRIYHNGQIVVMNASNDVEDILVTDCGVVASVGDQTQLVKHRKWYSRMVDLQGATVVPGFIDTHSHFPLVGLSELLVDLQPSPVGDVDSIDTLYERIASEVQRRPEGEWVIGFNYDNTRFTDGLHPDRYALDLISPQHPVFVRHISGHMGVANSQALHKLGFDRKLAPDEVPFAGVYPGGGDMNGLLQEKLAPSLTTLLSEYGPMSLFRLLQAGTHEYAAAGYTTVQAGGINRDTERVLSWLSRLGLIPLRLVVWLLPDAADRQQPLSREEYFESDSYRVAAIKLLADGSPQGFTAYLAAPYASPPVNEPADYRGRPLVMPGYWSTLLKRYSDRDWPLAVHVNGDGAVDDVLDAMEQLQKRGSFPKLVMIHAQTIREDQIMRAAHLGVEASFFVGHTFYWGDWHLERTLGPQRGQNISPLAWADLYGLGWTLHTDAPVTPVSVIDTLRYATHRVTRAGVRIGAHQQVSIGRALRAVTVDAARQWNLSDRGSLVVGKRADFVVLSSNPLTADDLQGLRVIKTVVDGRLVYSATPR